MLTGLAQAAIEEGKCCAVITLDVKNAFNSAKWNKIIEALEKIQAPKYIVRIVVEFLLGRRLYCDSDDGLKIFPTTCGVPQGSVLGPLLWLVMYDGVLTLRLPDNVTTIGFADDIGITVVAKHQDEIEIYANEAIWEINSWLRNSGLSLAEHKTEVVLISKRRKNTTVKIKVGGKTIYSQPSLKYLGVIIDRRLNFKRHIEYAATKASSIATTISRILPNIGGPRQSRRLLLSRVVSSVLLYAAPVWATALNNKVNCRKLGMAYRLSALRVCSAYRTTSGEAAYVLAGMLPIDILAKESRRLYDKTYAAGESSAFRRQLARWESIERWQQRWDESQTGRWTYRIIPDIRRWFERNHGELSHELTQFLSGHGGYRAYLHRFGHDESPCCPRCGNVAENAEHVIFDCPRFTAHRTRMEAVADRRLTPENIVEFMLESTDAWNQVVRELQAIHQQLRQEELRRKQGRERTIMSRS